MAVTTVAAIDIGSYETSMKIFEFSKSVARPDKVRFTNTLHRRADPEQKGSNEL